MAKILSFQKLNLVVYCILQAAMGELGHENLDMEKLNQSYRYYLYEVDLHANSAYEIDCPEFEKYLLVNG